MIILLTYKQNKYDSNIKVQLTNVFYKFKYIK